MEAQSHEYRMREKRHWVFCWSTRSRGFLFAVVLAAIFFAMNYVAHDQERFALTEEVRKSLPGTFVRLPGGTTHSPGPPMLQLLS